MDLGKFKLDTGQILYGMIIFAKIKRPICIKATV